MSTPSISQQQLAAYRSTSQRRAAERRRELADHKQRAWRAAHDAAELLRNQFGATRVVVFGSLVVEGCFTIWSDVDIAAWGLALEQTFRAMGAARDLSDKIDVNLVDIATCRPTIRQTIEQQGIDL